MGEATEMNLKEWQKRKRLSDSDIFTSEYLNRIESESELVKCACGCGEWRPRFDEKGIERNYISGHQSRGRKHSAESITKMQETRRKNQESSEKRRLMRKHGKLFKNLKEVFKWGRLPQ